MSKLPLSDIIVHLQNVSKEIAKVDSELAVRINQSILDLQHLDTLSKADKVIDRTKKIAEIVGPLMKLIYEFFKGP